MGNGEWRGGFFFGLVFPTSMIYLVMFIRCWPQCFNLFSPYLAFYTDEVKLEYE